MPTLVLATSGPGGEVGLEVPDGRLLTLAVGEGTPRGRDLLARIDDLLRTAGHTPKDLVAIAVDLGPGSFTGVRVGVTAAKTLAWALGIPVVGVTSLAALARAAPPDREVLSVREAGRGRLYHAAFGGGAGRRRALVAGPGRAPAAEVLSLQGDRLLVSEDPEDLRARYGGGRGGALRASVTAAAVLAEARADLEAGRAGLAHSLAPVYLQASAPERKRAGEEAGDVGGPPAAAPGIDRS